MLRVNVGKVEGHAKALVSAIPIDELPPIEMYVDGERYQPKASDYVPGKTTTKSASIQDVKATPAGIGAGSEYTFFSQSVSKKDIKAGAVSTPEKTLPAAPESAVKPNVPLQQGVNYKLEVKSGIGFDFSKEHPKHAVYRIGTVSGGGVGFRF